jgi:3-deoxy-D-manno-octulosonic-acid transferase-like protein
MGDDGSGEAALRDPALAQRAALLCRHERSIVAAGPSYVLERAGALVQRARTSIWIHGETPAQFDSALRLIQEIMRERPHVRLVLTSVAPATVAYLRRSFPDDHRGAAPWSAAGAVRRFLVKVNPRLVVLLDGGRSLGARTVGAVVARGVPLVALAIGGDTDVAPHVVDALHAAGTRGRRVVLHDRSAKEALRAVNALRDLLPDSPALPRVRQAWRVATFRDRVGQSRLWTSLSPILSRRRIDDWAALRARLGAPRSVLVLGNGPSCEDPRLEGIEHDCLIRVNWRWRERGLLTNPDLVFVGDAATMSKIRSCIFGFWNVALERGMLLRRLARRGPRPVEFVTMERLSPVIRDREWSARPTNGALAVLAAAALQPDRLTVAGIDLFRHPAGRYPGEALARNDYSHVHAMETDLAIIRLALREYRGELVVLSEILRRELAARSTDFGEVR